jgi:hypothetical protein
MLPILIIAPIEEDEEEDGASIELQQPLPVTNER